MYLKGLWLDTSVTKKWDVIESLDVDMETRPPVVVRVSCERVEVCACSGGGSFSRTAVKPAGKMM